MGAKRGRMGAKTSTRTAERCGRTAETSRMTADRCTLGADGCGMGATREDAVGRRQQAVGRRKKKKKFRKLGEKLAVKARPSFPNRAVPMRAPVSMGAIAEKAIRIQRVSILILTFPSSLVTRHQALPFLCRNVAVFGTEKRPAAIGKRIRRKFYRG